MEDLTTIKSLIKAMGEYAELVNWTDAEYIDVLIDLGITKEDFINCGYNKEYAEEYF
jgi:hypothetical protein